MGAVFSSLEGLVRNPVALRLVANSLLLVSDVDVVFTSLFTVSIIQTGGRLGICFGAVLVLGQLLYLVGVCCVAPRQKYQTMEMMKDLMKRIPDEFYDPITKQRISETSLVTRSSDRPGTTFEALPHDDDGYEQFKAGMSSYGLVHLWTAVECKNAKGCAQMSHGVPILRLAAYGFMAQPSAKDLAGILNCNALYTLSTGVPMMAFGAFLFTQTPLTSQHLLPLGISTASLVLSLAHIWCDFASILQQLDEEPRLFDDLLSRSAAALEREKHNMRRQRDCRLRDIENQFEGEVDAATLEDKAIKLQHVNDDFALAMKEAAEFNSEIVGVELYAFRRRVSVIRAQLRGRSISKLNGRGSAANKSTEQLEILQETLRKIEDECENVVKELKNNMENLDAATLRQKTIAAHTERQKKSEIIQRHIDALRG